MATIKDVAADARLGVGTVSRYLNGKSVTEENRKRIEDSIKKLRYRRNEVARGLKTHRTNIIGVVIPDFSDIYATSLVKSIENVAYGYGYNTISCDSDLSLELEMEKVDLLVRRGVDGLIVFPVSENATYFNDLDIPVVMVNSALTSNRFDSIMSDDFDAGKQAGTWFYDAGHTQVAVISEMKNRPGRLRAQGLLSVFQEKGQPLAGDMVLDLGFQMEAGYEGLRQIMNMANRPSALFTTNYYTTVGVLKYALEHHIRFPEDISFIGFDNIGAIDVLTPAVSIIQQPMDQIGKEAVKLLVRRMEEKDSSRTDGVMEIMLKTQLLVRDSSSPYRTHTG